MNLPITATGRTGTVTFDGQTVTIKRSGFLAMATAGTGEKRIPIGHITAVQFKPAHTAINGFIQFTIGGGIERRSKLGKATQDAMKDENSLVFWKRQQPEFEALRDAIETAQHSQRRPQSEPDAGLGTQLAHLAQLHGQGALSDVEYAAAKARLLG